MINDAAEEAVAVIENVAFRWLVIDDPSVAEPFGLAVRCGFNEERNASTRCNRIVGEAGLEEWLKRIAMVVAMNAIKLVLNGSLKLNVVTDAVAATVALGLASISAGILFLIRALNDQLACSIGQFVLFVLITRDDVIAVLHPLNVRLRRSTNAALQCQHVMMQIVAF